MRLRKKQTPLAMTLCSSLLLLASTNSEARDLQWVLQMGVDVGGDKIADVYFDDGSNQTINAGGLIQFGGGVLIDTLSASSVYQTQLTINWKFDSAQASNGDVSWDRYPLEVIQFYNTDLIRIGAGLSYHLSPAVSTSGFASGNDIDFDNALGLVLEVDYKFGEKGYFGGRLTSIEYQESTTGTTIDGSSIGLTLGAHF